MHSRSRFFEHFTFTSIPLYLAFKFFTPAGTMSNWKLLAIPVAIAVICCLLIEMYQDKVMSFFKRR